MFKRYIAKDMTPFTSDEADNLFKIEDFGMLGGERSLVATLRALITPRMSEDENLRITSEDIETGSYEFSYYDDETIMNNIVGIFTPNAREVLYIKSLVYGNEEYRAKTFEYLEKNFESRYEGWHRLTKITDFFRKSFRVMCFINPSIHSTILFVETLDNARLHYLQCATFAFLPWFFEKDKNLTGEEMELINSLREKTETNYINCLVKMSKKYDFRTMLIKTKLEGFETRFERIEVEDIQRCIEHYIAEINRLNSQIGQLLNSKNESEIRLLGYQAKIESNEDSEIMEYFLANQNLVLQEVTDQYMCFGVKSYVNYFDEDIAERMIETKSSYVYRPNGRACNNIIPEDDMEMLMRAIFIDQILKLRFCATYVFYLSGNIQAPNNCSYGYEFRDCMPNTHTDRYSCLGNYQRVINELLLKHDYIGALEQCIASCGSLNFADATVMEEFMRRIYGISTYDVNTRCIELPGGEVVTPKEAITWLHKQEDGENE